MTMIIIMGKLATPNLIEKKLYELLGIQIFRKLVLKLENLIHYKDKKRNINYHLRGRGINSVQSFTGYLLYNAVCHGLSIIFITIYISIMWIYKDRCAALDIYLYGMLLVNLYCLMLQRYTYIKIRAFEEKRINTKNCIIAEKIKLLFQRIENRSYNELQREYSLIERIRESINNGTDCVIWNCDAYVLRNISKCAGDIFKTKIHYEIRDREKDSPKNIIDRIPKCPVVTRKIEKRVASLQNLFHLRKHSNILFEFSIITETKDCEDAYNELIQDFSRDSVEFIFDVLFGAYNEALLSLREI